MGVKIGNLDISAFKVGGSDCSIYLGDVKLYPSEQPSFQGKWLATYTAGTTSSAECDSTSAITQNEINITDLQSVIIGDCVTSIGNRVFSGCTSLTSIDIPNSVTSIGYQAFRYCTSLSSIDIPSGVTNIGGSAFRECTSLTSINIPNSVTSIGGYAFSGCTSLPSIIIPDSVTSIGNTAFRDCTSITSIDIPNSVTIIGNDAFEYCTSLSSCTIGSGVTSIGASAFYGCSSLTSIDIPSSVTSIYSYAFLGCTSLTSITVNATTPPALSTSVFNNTNDCPIYVPSESLEAYKTSWSTYASRIQAIPSPYQWVTFTNGDTISSDLDVYGVSGISQDLLDTYGSSNLNVQFSPSRNWVEYYIYDSGGLNCKSGAELATDPMEIIFSEVSCIDYFNQGATVSGTIQLYIYT